MEIHSHGTNRATVVRFRSFWYLSWGFGVYRVDFCVVELSEIWKVFKFDIVPAEGWQILINCGQWQTTGGPTHAIPLPNLFTKRVPIT